MKARISRDPRRRAGTEGRFGQPSIQCLHVVVVSRPRRPVRLCAWARARSGRRSWRCGPGCRRRRSAATYRWGHRPRDATSPGHRRSRGSWPWGGRRSRCRRCSRLRRHRRYRRHYWFGCGSRLSGGRLACRGFPRGGLARCALSCLTGRLPCSCLARRLLSTRLSCRLTGAGFPGARLPGGCATTSTFSCRLPSTRSALRPTLFRSHGLCSDSAPVAALDRSNGRGLARLTLPLVQACCPA